jgi:hypothetical protein
VSCVIKAVDFVSIGRSAAGGSCGWPPLCVTVASLCAATNVAAMRYRRGSSPSWRAYSSSTRHPRNTRLSASRPGASQQSGGVQGKSPPGLHGSLVAATHWRRRSRCPTAGVAAANLLVVEAEPGTGSHSLFDTATRSTRRWKAGAGAFISCPWQRAFWWFKWR